jgi:hypothetical protein
MPTPDDCVPEGWTPLVWAERLEYLAPLQHDPRHTEEYLRLADAVRKSHGLPPRKPVKSQRVTAGHSGGRQGTAGKTKHGA